MQTIHFQLSRHGVVYQSSVQWAVCTVVQIANQVFIAQVIHVRTWRCPLTERGLPLAWGQRLYTALDATNQKSFASTQGCALHSLFPVWRENSDGEYLLFRGGIVELLNRSFGIGGTCSRATLSYSKSIYFKFAPSSC